MEHGPGADGPLVGTGRRRAPGGNGAEQGVEGEERLSMVANRPENGIWGASPGPSRKTPVSYLVGGRQKWGGLRV